MYTHKRTFPVNGVNITISDKIIYSRILIYDKMCVYTDIPLYNDIFLNYCLFRWSLGHLHFG